MSIDSALLASLARSADSHVVQATLVSATGSSSKKIGAKMFVGASGALLGGVTIGGCVDAQVIEASDALVASGGRRILDIALDDDEAWEMGLTCGGTVQVALERVAPGDERDPTMAAYAAAAAAIDAGRSCAVVTSLDGPRASLTVDERGDRTGTLGDPVVDDAAAVAALDVLRSGSRLDRLATARGERRVFLERFEPPTTLVIVGAGQVAMSLTRFARELELRTIVVDGRERYATRERFPGADEIRVGMPSEIVAALGLTPRVAVILVAHDYKYELPVLRQALRSPAGYVGMLGSKSRGAAVRAVLRDEGMSDDDLARLHTPIGLDLGGRSSPEVALSIVAEVVAVRAGKRA